jgi:S1-C subfamily serine protease
MNRKILLISSVIAVVVILGSVFFFHGTSGTDSTHNLDDVQESFTLVLVKNHLVLKGCISPPGKPTCDKMKLPPISPPIRTMGSGAVIAHGVNTTYVITAGHVCTFDVPTQNVSNGYTFFVEPKVEIKVVDYWGKSHATTVVAQDHENDICILRSRGIWSTPLPIAAKMPKVGERVTTIAAPRGIFHPRMVLQFDGRYVGIDDHGHTFFTTPTAPGSSGSVILNSNGEVVSVIHSAMRRFENVGIGSQLGDVLELIRLNVSSVPALSQMRGTGGYLGAFPSLP